MIAFFFPVAFARWQNVVAQAEEITLTLAREAEGVQRLFRARRKERYFSVARFGFKKLPDSAHLHEFGSFVFYFLHALVEFDGLGFAFRETLFKVAAEAEMPAVKHEWIDVGPQLVQIGYEADFAF